jgi:aryl-alcohol dehydrogenase-like predicted oxidoreductase
VSVVGLGTWQLGGDWGDVDESRSFDILAAAVESGVTLFDTADVYGDGRSERTIGRFLREHPGTDVFVATKMGRRLPQELANYTLDNFRHWTERSRRNLGVDTLDLVQLHCPPSDVFADDSVFDALDTLVDEGAVANYAVSVETVDQALASIARPQVAAVQIILNAFRQKPLQRVLPAAAQAGVGILARVPLASGLLSGRFTHETTFAADDHRAYNRDGQAFDVGETFAGIDYDTGVEAATAFAALSEHPAQLALRWVIDQPGVTSVIPGASRPEQARDSAASARRPPLDSTTVAAISDIYDSRIRTLVEHRW